MMMEFDEDIKKQAPPKLRPVLDQFAEAVKTFTDASSEKVRWHPSKGDVRDLFNNHVDMLRAAYKSKISFLMQGIIISVNRRDFLTYALLGRSLIEHAAVLRYYHTNLIVPQLQEPIKRGTVTTEEIQQLIDILHKHLRGGRFDWQSFLTGDLDKLLENTTLSIPYQVNVKTCMEKWTKETPSVKVLYDLFCDLVHPNIGSTLLIMKQWPDGIGFGGQNGKPFGIDIFNRTFVGLAGTVKEISGLMAGLILLRFPEDQTI